MRAFVRSRTSSEQPRWCVGTLFITRILFHLPLPPDCRGDLILTAAKETAHWYINSYIKKERVLYFKLDAKSQKNKEHQGSSFFRIIHTLHTLEYLKGGFTLLRGQSSPDIK